MRTTSLTWLWSVWRALRFYRSRKALLSKRIVFLRELRPFASPTSKDRIDYPDAIFWIQPHDVDRAKKAALTAPQKDRECATTKIIKSIGERLHTCDFQDRVREIPRPDICKECERQTHKDTDGFVRPYG